MRSHLVSLVLWLGACGSKQPAAAPTAGVAGRAWVVGTWTTSTTSWADAAKSADATRFAEDGVIEHGAWTGGKFVAAPSAGPSGSSFVARYALDPKAHTISFQLDGAEEQATYVVEAPDRWKTISSDAEHVTVFYARRE
ncbi:MAG: hypothetical protein JNL79_32635 [Myxococcales bacterium]|nr:hypothetical protein [Myxococcales bacterium]